jgi:hypothetical protein
MLAVHVLVRLAIGDEDELAVVEILFEIEHLVLEPAQAMPADNDRFRRVIGETGAGEYV